MQLKKLLLSLIVSSQIAIYSSAGFAAEPNWYAKGLRAEYAGDYQTAIQSYTKSAASGLSDASFAIGHIYKNQGNDVTSREWFLKAANAKNKYAQYELGLMYLNGTSATAHDTDEAIKWFTYSAKAGLGEASYELFKLVGDIKWLKIAANNGVKQAAGDMAIAYEQGLYGAVVDEVESERWSQLHLESLEQETQQGAAQ